MPRPRQPSPLAKLTTPTPSEREALKALIDAVALVENAERPLEGMIGAFEQQARNHAAVAKDSEKASTHLTWAASYARQQIARLKATR